MSTEGLYGVQPASPVEVKRSRRQGVEAFSADAVADAKQALAEAAREEEQLDLLEPLSAEDMESARDGLGHSAGLVSVMREARKLQIGRRLGSKNRRTEDFIKYISQFGQDPAITMMQIQSTPPEELVARSKLLDPPKRQMSYADAQGLRIRCAEALIPYLHSKQPVAVDATIRGVMVVEEIGGPRSAIIDMDGEPLGILPIDDGEDV